MSTTVLTTRKRDSSKDRTATTPAGKRPKATAVLAPVTPPPSMPALELYDQDNTQVVEEDDITVPEITVIPSPPPEEVETTPTPPATLSIEDQLALEEDVRREEEASKAVVLVNPAEQQVAVVAPPPQDISHEIAQALRCCNLYFKDQAVGFETFSARAGEPKNDNTHGRLNIKPYRPQTFMGTKLPYGKYVLAPLLPLSEVWMHPYGDMDYMKKVPAVKSDFDVPVGKEDQAKLALTIRPEFFSVFSQSPDGCEDVIGLQFMQWLLEMVEPKVCAAMAQVPTLVGSEGFASIMKDKCIYPDRFLMTEPSKDRKGDDVLLKQILDKSYQAQTKFLSKICIEKVKLVRNDLFIYRITTPAERAANPSGPPVVLMSMEEQSMIVKGDEFMALMQVDCLRNNKNFSKMHLKLAGGIWFGPSKHYLTMKANTAEEKFRLVPDCPVPPPASETWLRKRRMYEEGPRTDAFNDMLKRARMNAGNAE